MKKLFLLALSVLLSIGAWAETAIFSSGYMTSQIGSVEQKIADGNVFLGDGTNLSTAFKIEINENRTKALTKQSTITVDGTPYNAFKNSNGAQMTITLPEGKVATAVDFYATTNNTTTSGKLSEIDGTSCSDEVSSKSDGANPTKISKNIAYKNSFTFTFGTQQVFFIAVVTYQEALPEYTFGIGRNVTAQGTEPETYVIDAEDTIKGSYPEQITNVTIASSSNIAWTTRTNEKLYSFVNDEKTEVLASKCANNRVSSAAVAELTDNFYFGYTFDIAEGYRLNITNIAAELAPSIGRASSIQVKIYQVTSTSETLLYAGDAINATSDNVPTYSKAIGAVTALQGLSGKIAVRMLWIQSGSSSYAALRNLNIKASVEEITLTGKEYALKEVKINDATYDYTTSGNTVTESYASLPSVKFIYSVKKVWSDGVKTDTEDEEEVVTPTLVGGNQVATTTKLAEPFTLTFTNIAQFQVVPNAVGTYIDLSSAVVTNCNVENNGKNIGSTKNGSTMTINLTNTTAGDYILQFLSGAQNLTATVDINIKGSDYDKTQSFNIANTGAWTLSEFHAMELKNLPAGNLTLKLTVTGTTDSYAGNYGSFAIRGAEDYIDLATGTYFGAKTIDNPTSQGGKKVGYCSNNTSATYHFYAPENGNYNLCMAMKHSANGSMNVRISDYATGTEEVNQDIAITSDFCKGYGVEVPMALSSALTAGIKTIQLTFTTTGNYLMDYENVRITKILPTFTLINAVLNGGSNAPTVTGTYAGSAVAKTQNTADATLGGYKFDQGCYVGLTLAAGYTFKAGDVLHVNVTSKCTGGSKLALYSDLGTTFICTTGIGQETGDLTFTLTDAFNGLSTFYLYRSQDYGWNGYVASVSVEGVSRERVEQTYSINYSLGESGAQGTVPAAIAAENILTKYAAPVNQTLYKEGYTLKGWTDGENEYLIGQLYDMTEGEHNLTPVFVANTETLAFVKSDLEVIWYFGIKNGAPTYTGAADVQTKQVNLNNEMIDLAVLMAGGDNSGRNDEWMNNQQKNITVPVCAGAIVKAKVFYTYDAVFNGETITYNAEFGTQGNVVYTYVCPNTVGSTIDVNVGNQFLSYIQVQYPAHATISDQMTAEAMAALDGFTGDVTVNRSLTAGMFNTICLPFAMSAAEISAKLGTCDIRELSEATLNDNELVLTFATATEIEAGKPYLIKPEAAVIGWTMENVTLSTTATSTVATSADFIGVLTPTELAASENTLCVGANNTLFYVNSTSTMKGLRAYFQVKGAAVGAPARISLGSHVATGVENVNDNANVSKLIEQGRVIIRIDGHDYDLNGRMIR